MDRLVIVPDEDDARLVYRAPGGGGLQQERMPFRDVSEGDGVLDSRLDAVCASSAERAVDELLDDPSDTTEWLQRAVDRIGGMESITLLTTIGADVSRLAEVASSLSERLDMPLRFQRAAVAAAIGSGEQNVLVIDIRRNSAELAVIDLTDPSRPEVVVADIAPSLAKKSFEAQFWAWLDGLARYEGPGESPRQQEMLWEQLTGKARRVGTTYKTEQYAPTLAGRRLLLEVLDKNEFEHVWSDYRDQLTRAVEAVLAQCNESDRPHAAATTDTFEVPWLIAEPLSDMGIDPLHGAQRQLGTDDPLPLVGAAKTFEENWGASVLSRRLHVWINEASRCTPGISAPAEDEPAEVCWRLRGGIETVRLNFYRGPYTLDGLNRWCGCSEAPLSGSEPWLVGLSLNSEDADGRPLGTLWIKSESAGEWQKYAVEPRFGGGAT